MKRLSILFVGLLFTPFLAFAINVTVPAAPSSGYFLVSTTTGAYVASSTPNFTTGLNLAATSTGSFGINLSGGCFAVNGVCLSSGGSGVGTSTNPFMATYFVATSTTQASFFPYASTTALSAVGTIFANNFYDTSLSGNTCVSESSSLIVGSTYCVTSVGATYPLASSGGTNTVISSATSSGSSAGVLLYPRP